MGRDWLSKLKLDWHQIRNTQQANPPKPKLQDIVQQFPKLFDESIPSSDYTPVTDKPTSKLDTPLPEQGNSLTFPTAEESAMQEEPKTLTRPYSRRERKPLNA
ncbi:hypothetical protein P5673_009948 [Acropora cervicornis]|uniref:Uncharacterized protein n=1 Tax=Acropora cervicornis TaxID=6130 RepID=A0AAD9V9P0_ACRCE|nr:hypothetical protein P5673_009948 [Acropora cervicornis]